MTPGIYIGSGYPIKKIVLKNNYGKGHPISGVKKGEGGVDSGSEAPVIRKAYISERDIRYKISFEGQL